MRWLIPVVMFVASAYAASVWLTPENMERLAPAGRRAVDAVRTAVAAVDVREPPRVVYLNREGAVLTAGPDDASSNRSSVVSGADLDRYTTAAFGGPPSRWRRIVRCVRARFADFDVEIVDQRPMTADYDMVLVGGRGKGLKGKRRRDATGLAPWTGRVVNEGIALVFSASLDHDARNVCETIADEIGHLYGLDHTRDCRDLMTHMGRCGRRRFVDAALRCGEKKSRKCESGSARQNSYRKLMATLGPKRRELAMAIPASVRPPATGGGRVGTATSVVGDVTDR